MSTAACQKVTAASGHGHINLQVESRCRYSKEWEKTVTRLGRWIDFENDYKTLDPTFMETVWWVFGELWKKDLVYKGFKVSQQHPSCALQ